MGSVFAELNSRVLAGLPGAGPELCSLQEVHQAVVQAHAVRAAQAGYSSINVILSVSQEFYPTSEETDVTTYLGGGVPVGLEVRGEGGDVFRPVEIVNRAQLAGGKFSTAGAFYTVNGRQLLGFQNVPEGGCRIVFDSDQVKTSVNDESALPLYVDELIVVEAQNMLIPRIKLKIAANLSRSEEARQDAMLVIGLWDGVLQQNLMRLPDLLNLWRVWAFKDRRSESSFARRTPAGKRLYGD